jgi:hypothetical protein
MVEETAKINTDLIKDWVAYAELKDAKQRKGHRSPPVPDKLKPIVGAENFLQSSMGAHYGTNQERALLRQLVNSKFDKNGLAHIFFTLSPDSSKTYLIAELFGTMNPTLLDGLKMFTL